MKRELTISLTPDWKAKLHQAGEKMQRSIDTGTYQGEQLNFESPQLFFGKLTERRWILVQRLQQAGEGLSVREIARLVDRGVRRVHDDLKVLLELGLVEKTEDGRIACPYQSIHVDMHLRAA
jgi:predicted transcriptional regulator